MIEDDYLDRAKELRLKFYRGLAGPALRWDQLTPEQQQRWINRAKGARS